MSVAAPAAKTQDHAALEHARQTLARFRGEVVAFLKGKEAVADVVLCSLLSAGHLLFEDVPGVGKTTLIKALARMLGLELTRIQCTSDLLPSDILGVEVFTPSTETFSFHRGPVFSHLILVDELNRASPRTQSALLEAMAEGMVSINRKTYHLPQPFMVFATQNPSDSIGTYPLPESQLDRFAAKVHLHYPVEEREREIFRMSTLDPLVHLPENLVGPAALAELQKATESIFISDRVIGFMKKIVDLSRRHESLRLGVSTRGGVIWLRMARAMALVRGRDYVVPDDLILLAPACLAHRVIPRSGADTGLIIEKLIQSVEVD